MKDRPPYPIHASSSLLSIYQRAVMANEIKDDAMQRMLLSSFQAVLDGLSSERKHWFLKRRTQIQGIYLYGPVGRGKTYLMDLFYHAMGRVPKQRIHYHHFMQQVDADLRRLQGQRDPLKRIAKQLARKARVLCLDEFMVHDIADAMILAELFKALFKHGVTLVATSNIRPDDLYLNGLQRVRFLPAIDLIKAHCKVLNLADEQDYRLGRVRSLYAYLYPCNETSQQRFAQQFSDIAHQRIETTPIRVQSRLIDCIKRSEDVIWFNFKTICSPPRSQLDYIEIANRFKTVFVSDVPCLRRDETTQALLFGHFIDVMYDQTIRVMLLANGPVDSIYAQEKLNERFKRTVSRLKEMQSEGYLDACSKS